MNGLEPVVAPPDAGEMALRLARVRERMAAQDLDALIVHCPDNVFYLTNFANYVHERPFVLVVPRSGALPFLAVAYPREIEPGMLFSIEPGIYLPGLGGFRHSDTVLVTEGGNRCLTTAPDSLEALVLAC